MAVCNVQELLLADPCLTALNTGTLKAIKLQMLCNLRDKLENGGDPTCDIEDLLAEANCFYGLSEGLQDVIELQLLCEILALV